MSIMKKLTLFIVFVLCVFTLQSQNWLEFTASESTFPTYNIVQSNLISYKNYLSLLHHLNLKKMKNEYVYNPLKYKYFWNLN